MDLVEAIARALCKARYDNSGVESDDGWDSATPLMQAEYRRVARVVVEVVHKYQAFA